jgi:hypothetical protein
MLSREGTMRTLLCLLLVAAFAGIAVADVNVTGKWTGNFKVSGDGDGGDSAAVSLLKQNGSEVTGSLGPNEGEQHQITKGKIDGDKITLEVTEGSLVIKLDLVLAEDRITGDVNAAGEGRTLKGRIDVKREK